MATAAPPTFFLNIHTKDLAAATAFFQAIGFTHLTHWSDDKSSSFTLPAPNQNVALMIHTHARYKDFIRPGNTLADPKTSSQALFSIGAKTKEEVDEALQKAVDAGGEKDPFVMEGYGEKHGMYTRSWTDLDGNVWETVATLGCP